MARRLDELERAATAKAAADAKQHDELEDDLRRLRQMSQASEQTAEERLRLLEAERLASREDLERTGREDHACSLALGALWLLLQLAFAAWGMRGGRADRDANLRRTSCVRASSMSTKVAPPTTEPPAHPPPLLRAARMASVKMEAFCKEAIEIEAIEMEAVNMETVNIEDIKIELSMV